MKNSANQFDIDGVDETMRKLESCKMPEDCKLCMDTLRAYVAEVMTDEIINMTDHMIQLLHASRNTDS